MNVNVIYLWVQSQYHGNDTQHLLIQLDHLDLTDNDVLVEEHVQSDNHTDGIPCYTDRILAESGSLLSE